MAQEEDHPGYPIGRVPNLCRDFLSGYCARKRENCKFVHVTHQQLDARLNHSVIQQKERVFAHHVRLQRIVELERLTEQLAAQRRGWELTQASAMANIEVIQRTMLQLKEALRGLRREDSQGEQDYNEV